MVRTRRRRSPPLLALALSVLFALVAAVAAAQPVIGPGHEQEILGLFAPFGMGSDVGAGYVLDVVSIEGRQVDVTLRASGRRTTQLSLQALGDAPSSAPRSASFSLVESEGGDEGAREARASLIRAIQTNDHGGFWTEVAEQPIVAGPDVHDAPELPLPVDLRRLVAHRSFTGWGPVDGIVVLALVYAFAALLAWRVSRDAPRWVLPSVIAIVIAGALVRLALSHETFLGAWPWSRLYPQDAAVADGPVLAAIAARQGHPFWLLDAIFWTNFAYAVAMPLVLFSHASYLLRDPRAGLAAAFAIAFLPQHVRFSRCEDAFVPSLVLTSLALALVHAWLRDPSRFVRIASVVLLPFVLYPGYLLRALSVLFVLVYGAALLTLHEEEAPRWRRYVGLAIVVGVGAFATWHFVVTNEETVTAALLSPSWVLEAPLVLLIPERFVLSDPRVTPPALMILAVVGGVLAWRAGEKALVRFLVGWLALFLVVHSFVMQTTMQPRYHLHLVVPFLMLAAIGASRLDARHRRWLALGGVTILLAPLLHGAFLHDLEFAETREYAFVRAQRDVIPEGCTVLEYVAESGDLDDRRFSRMGALTGSGDRPHHFASVGVRADGTLQPDRGRETRTLDEVIDGTECLYFYEGLACSTVTGGPPYARLCDDIRHRIGAEQIASGHAPMRFYDSSVAHHTEFDSGEVPLRLSVARAPVGARGRAR